jgi:transposase
MYIRKTTTKKAADGTAYSTFRLVASERVGGKVRQKTLLNIGSCFDLPSSSWGKLCSRIEGILEGSIPLLPLPNEIESLAQEFAARIIADSSVAVASKTVTEKREYEEVDISSLALLRPRSVGVEYVAVHATRQLQLPEVLRRVGFTENQTNMALANIIGRMVMPGSEKATWHWLTERSALGELLGVDFSTKSAMSLYRAADLLVEQHEILEKELFRNALSLFSLQETVTLYDLTNTYFEGQQKNNSKAKRGFSKEKRFDCPLMTLGLVIDGSSFVKRAQIFDGNVAESQTVEHMLAKLGATNNALIIMDRGIATQATLDWLVNAGYRYLVVSREQARQFDFTKAQTIETAQSQSIQIYKELTAEGKEARLYCYSERRAAKEQAILARFFDKFEAGLRKLSENLQKPRGRKNKEYILKRIGRLSEQCHGVSRHYVITVTDNASSVSAGHPLRATSITYEKRPVAASMATHPGVYCLRTNELSLDAEMLWRTYIMLTDIEAVFRSLKSELGLRPIYHSTQNRSEGHILISVLAYQCVQTLRKELQAHGIHDSWNSIRANLSAQQRITASFRQRNGYTMHVRKATAAEADQRRIYDALHLSHTPGGVIKHKVAIPAECSA